MGPLLIDVEGLALTADDRVLLQNPLVAGVILFSRNYADQAQLSSLISEIRAATSERLLISVDHEGGRVQRFKEGFTLIPPAQSFAMLYELGQYDFAKAKSLAFDAGWMIAMELMAFDIDLSYAPVLDIGHHCLAIGTRAFHHDIQIAIKIATAMIDGMHAAGMKTTGKHFPGHGAVLADSHKTVPIDKRSKEAIVQDMQIFADLIAANKLDAIMPAHVIYPAFDDKPASGSSYWLQTVLRHQLKFNGVIFSDDLSMEGAAVLGDYGTRAEAALTAGCDLLLACNNRSGTLAILDYLQKMSAKRSLISTKAAQLLKKRDIQYSDLINSDEWQIRHDSLMKLNQQWANSYASSSN